MYDTIRSFEILCIVSDTTGVPVHLIQSNTRRRCIADARHLASALLCCCGFTGTQAGDVLGRDRTTLINSKQVIKDALSRGDIHVIANFTRCLAKAYLHLKHEPTRYFLSSLDEGILKIDTSRALAVDEFCQKIKQMLGITTLVDTLPSDIMRRTLMLSADHAIDSMKGIDQDTGKDLSESMDRMLLSI